MADTIQEFLAEVTTSGVSEIVAALLALPADKRNWKPAPGARSALDQVAECAIVNGYMAEVIGGLQSTDVALSGLIEGKTALTEGEWTVLKELLESNTRKLAAALRAVPDAMLNVELSIPWGTQPLRGFMTYPYWNLAYHLGQINYIRSLLEAA
jgi:hypothetical protein